MSTYSLKIYSVEEGRTIVEIEMDHWEQEMDGGVLEIAACQIPQVDVDLSKSMRFSFFRHVHQVGRYDVSVQGIKALQRGESLWMTPKARHEWQTDPEDFATTLKLVPYESGSSSDSEDDGYPLNLYFTCRRFHDLESDESSERDPENENRRLVPTSLGNLVWDYPKGVRYREHIGRQ